MKNRLLYTASLAVLLSSCAVGPDYEKPKDNYNSTWDFITNPNVVKPHGATTDNALKVQLAADNAKTADKADNSTATAAPQQDTEVFTKDEWWQNFNDPVLNKLIDQAEKNNYDLKIAEARIKEARGNRLSATATLLPKVDLQGNAARVKIPGIIENPTNIYEGDFDASWELDLFGGNRRRREAAEDKVQQAKADLHDTLISIRAEVARNYMEIRNFQNQIAITEENINSQEETLKLTRSQQQAGIVSGLDVTQQESQEAATRSRLPTLKSSLEQARNNLSVLLGEEPGKLDEALAAPATVPVADKKFLVDTPTQAIANRPDVKSAERNLAGATAMQGAALAEFFPKLPLTAFFGYTHAAIAAPGATWALMAAPSLNLLDFGRIRAGVNVANAQEEEAYNNYKKTVLTALSEIQTNLVNYVNEENRRQTLEEAASSSKKAVELSKERYNKGLSAFTDVLLAERQMYDVQSQLADSEALVAKNLIALNKSLGR